MYIYIYCAKSWELLMVLTNKTQDYSVECFAHQALLPCSFQLGIAFYM